MAIDAENGGYNTPGCLSYPSQDSVAVTTGCYCNTTTTDKNCATAEDLQCSDVDGNTNIYRQVTGCLFKGIIFNYKKESVKNNITHKNRQVYMKASGKYFIY